MLTIRELGLQTRYAASIMAHLPRFPVFDVCDCFPYNLAITTKHPHAQILIVVVEFYEDSLRHSHLEADNVAVVVARIRGLEAAEYGEVGRDVRRLDDSASLAVNYYLVQSGVIAIQ
jgi:hypothetical protein